MSTGIAGRGRVEVDIPDECLQSLRPLDIRLAPPPFSMALDWPSGGTGYVVSIRLLSRTRCVLEDCGVAVPWDDDVVIQSLDERTSRCNFGPLVFLSDEILNSRIEKTLRFPRAGHVVEGTILGRGGVPIPKQYTSLMRVPFALTLYETEPSFPVVIAAREVNSPYTGRCIV